MVNLKIRLHGFRLSKKILTVHHYFIFQIRNTSAWCLTLYLLLIFFLVWLWLDFWWFFQLEYLQCRGEMLLIKPNLLPTKIMCRIIRHPLFSNKYLVSQLIFHASSSFWHMAFPKIYVLLGGSIFLPSSLKIKRSQKPCQGKDRLFKTFTRVSLWVLFEYILNENVV